MHDGWIKYICLCGISMQQMTIMKASYGGSVYKYLQHHMQGLNRCTNVLMKGMHEERCLTPRN